MGRRQKHHAGVFGDSSGYLLDGGGVLERVGDDHEE